MGKLKAARRYADNEAGVLVRNIRISPQKLNLVAGMIRGKDCSTAVTELRFSRKRIAIDVRKALESAIANAENNHGLDIDRLYVSEATVGKSLIMKRWRPRARGRTGRIVKPFSNLRLTVSERAEEK